MEAVMPNFSDLLNPNIEVKNFPDGDSYVRILEPEKFKGKEVTIYARLWPEQNSRIFELILTARTLQKIGAEIEGAVIPYLPYSRQDKTFLEGEALSIDILLSMLRESGVEKIITFDCHFIKTGSGEYERAGMKIKNISLGGKLIEKAKEEFSKNLITISPDEGAGYMAEKSMKKVRGEYVKGKEAYRKIEKVEGVQEVMGRDVLIIDDMISTGGTMVRALENVKKAGARKVGVATVHAFFLKDSLQRIEGSADYIITSNTIQNKYAKINFMEAL
ncbi:MAG: ribose-phosphate diphosphokinase [Candidatus Anstonellales archaeon]